MRTAIQSVIRNGLPTVAECGGFLYLGQNLEDETGTSYPMAGVLNGNGIKKQKLVRFGYAYLTANSDSMLFLKGEQIPVHEFHYWDSTENGESFHAKSRFRQEAGRAALAKKICMPRFPICISGEIRSGESGL